MQPNDTPHDTSYDAFQRLVGNTLLAWGAGSTLAGVAGLFVRGNGLLRQAAIQSIAWGAIDAAIGLFGLRSARRQAARGEATAPQARRFRLIVLVNAGLDVGYIAGGLALVRQAQGRAGRAGMGVGIIIQGAFLLLFDTALTLLSGQWTSE